MRNLVRSIKINRTNLSLIDLIKLVYSVGFLLTGITLFIAGQLILNNTLYKESEFAGIGGSLGIVIQFIGIMSLFYGTLLSVIQIMCLLINNNSTDLKNLNISDTLDKDNTIKTYENTLKTYENTLKTHENTLKTHENTLKFLNVLYIIILILPIIYILLNCIVHL